MPRNAPIWSCCQRGDCCRLPAEVVMTAVERDVIRASTSRPLIFRDDADPRFVRLQAAPCPLLNEDGRCSVYDVRPYNCRRYLCGREGDAPWEGMPSRLRTSYQFLALYDANQRRASKWALAHGWTK